MAFSFNPTQTPQAGAGVVAGTAPASPVAFSGMGIQPAGAPTVQSFPGSPFLFLHNRDKPMSIGAYIQIMLMIITVSSIVVSGVLFAYSLYLGGSINTKKDKLAEEEKKIGSYPFEDMKKLSNGYGILGGLMKNYVSMRSPLKFLEYVVENQVEVVDFSVSTSPIDTGYSMSFTVSTANYKSLLQQLGALNLTDYSKIIKTPKPGEFTDSLNDLKLKVTTRIQGQGKTAEEIEKTFSESPILISEVKATTTSSTTSP